MADRRRSVYRGKRRKRTVITASIFILALLLGGAVIIFDSLQKYVVYGPDGLYLDLPILASDRPSAQVSEAAPLITGIPADIIIDEPDFEEITTSAGTDLAPIHALCVSAGDLLNGKLQDYVNLLEDYAADALIIEVKPESGRLVYSSTVNGAIAFDTVGAADLAQTAAALKEQDIYLVARISCCVDELIATRNIPVALRDASGAPWSDSDGRYWLDARNRGIRDYLTDLITELSALGFDEVMLTNVALPAADAGDGGPFPSSADTVDSDAYAAVSNLALSLSNVRDGAGIKVSALCEAYPDERSGQSVEFFLKVFDRIYCPTSSAALEDDRAAVTGVMASGAAAARFVPIISAAAESGSWAVSAQ